MKRNKTMLIFSIIMLFAIIGVITQFIGNPRGFINGIFITLGFAVVIFGIFYFVMNRMRNSSDETKKYRQAVKQSKSKYHQSSPRNATNPTAIYRKPTTPKKPRKRPTHLRVIEGNKEKGKDRASL